MSFPQVGVERVDSMSVTYRNLLTRLPTGTDPLLGAYEAIEARCREVQSYVKVKYHMLRICATCVCFS